MADDPMGLPAKDRRGADRRTSGRTGVLIGVLLSGVSIALTVGFLEALTVTGLVDYRSVLGTPIDEPWSHPDNLLDPRLLHIHMPYHRQWFAGIEYRYDRHGLRNERDLEAADIVVVGDSFIEGWRVSAGDMLTTRLAEELDVTVANLGQSWYGPQQELELLRRYGVPLRPKVCVWAFYEGNDLRDVQRYDEATRNWDAFAQEQHTFARRSFTRNVQLAVRRILDSMRRDDAAHEAEAKKLSGIFAGPGDTKTTMIFLREWHGPSVPEYVEPSLKVVHSTLERASELCRANGAELLVVFIPTKLRVYRDLTSFDADAEPPRWVIDDLPQRLEAALRRDLPEVRFLDLTAVLTDAATKGSLLYFAEWDTHWTAEGHRVAAAAIAERLHAHARRSAD